MSERPPIHSGSSCSLHYQQSRRRWVPKGVMLLAVLFVVGLLGACQNAPEVAIAAIAVPAETTVQISLDEGCVYTPGNVELVRAERLAHLQPDSLDRVGLNVF